MRIYGMKENLGKWFQLPLKLCLGYCALSQSGQVQMNVNEIFGYSLSQGR